GRIPPLRGGFRSQVRKWLHRPDEWAGYPRWLNPDFEKRAALRQRWKELHQPQRWEHPLGDASLHNSFWGSALETHDAGWTGIQLESRAPLLDLRVLRFLLRLPPVPWCANKELVRLAMKGRLPKRVLRRPKCPLPQDPLQACFLWKPVLPSDARED